MSSVASQPQGAGAPAMRRPVAEDLALQQVLPWLLLGLALALRLFQINANGLRTDEMYSVWMASRPLPEMLNAIVIEGHDATPPTYYAVLHLALQASTSLMAIRLVSVLAGALSVFVTFHLARALFDVRVAALSGLLLALAPFHVEVSQVARAYALTGVFVLASLFYFVRLARPHRSPATVWLFALFTLAAIATHYLAGLMVVFYSLVVLALAAAGQLSRRRVLEWFKLQFLLVLVSLPLAVMAVQRIQPTSGSTGQGWLPAPSLTGLVKAFILWGTGDPSFGGAAFTVARLLSLLVLSGTLAVGAFTAWRLWQGQSEHRHEARRWLFVAAAFVVPWAMAVGISLVRKIFHEKYFIYLAPLLLMALAWAVLRARPAWLGQGLMLGLVGLTAWALGIYYRSPTGEQWREAMAYIRAEQEPADFVVIAPGYYVRPAAYYLRDELAPVDYLLLRAPFSVMGPQGYQGAALGPDSDALPAVDELLGPARRVWVVTGYAEVEPEYLAWFYDNFEIQSEQQFLGVQVALGTRSAAGEPGGLRPVPSSRSAGAARQPALLVESP